MAEEVAVVEEVLNVVTTGEEATVEEVEEEAVVAKEY